MSRPGCRRRKRKDLLRAGQRSSDLGGQSAQESRQVSESPYRLFLRPHLNRLSIRMRWRRREAELGGAARSLEKALIVAKDARDSGRSTKVENVAIDSIGCLLEGSADRSELAILLETCKR